MAQHRLLFLLVCAAPAAVEAQGTPPATPPAEQAAKPPVKHAPVVKFTGDLGFVSTSGNTSVQTLNVGDKISAKFGVVTVSQQFSVVHGRSKGQTVTSLYRGAVRTDVALEKTFGLYASVTFERNIFAGLVSRIAGVVGVSAELFSTPQDRMIIESGVSLNRQRNVDTSKRPDVDNLGGRAASAYTHKFGPKASFAQSVELLPNFRDPEDLRVNTESAILAPITKDVGVKLSYVIRYDGLPNPGYQATDRLFTSGIQISL